MTKIRVPPGRPLTNAEQEKVYDRIATIVWESLTTRPMPSGIITERECSDRLEVACAIWNYTYGECGWSKERALDLLPRYLIACIDGARVHDLDVEPAPRDGAVGWAPEAAARVEPERRLSALAPGAASMVQPQGDEEES